MLLSFVLWEFFSFPPLATQEDLMLMLSREKTHKSGPLLKQRSRRVLRDG
jgi:hypothetical protein